MTSSWQRSQAGKEFGQYEYEMELQMAKKKKKYRKRTETEQKWEKKCAEAEFISKMQDAVKTLMKWSRFQPEL